MTTMLEEIKQRDEFFTKFVHDEDASEAALDRRWLLARVEELEDALVDALPEIDDSETYTKATQALASLTAPVSSHSEEQS